MSISIGSSSLSCTIGAQPSRTALDADLAKYQKQLSDSVNCASSKTLEGKTQIQELSNKITETQARIKQVVASSPPANATAVNESSAPAASDGYTNAGVPAGNSGTEQGVLVDLVA